MFTHPHVIKILYGVVVKFHAQPLFTAISPLPCKLSVDSGLATSIIRSCKFLPFIVIQEGTIQLAQMKFSGGQTLARYGPLTASLTLSSLPIIAFYLALQKYIIKGIAAGAVKG